MEQRGRDAYQAYNSNNNITVPRGDEKYPDIFLPAELYEELAELGKKHMKEGITLSPFGVL